MLCFIIQPTRQCNISSDCFGIDFSPVLSGVNINMDAAAQFITFSSRNVELLPDAIAQIAAIFSAAGRSHISRRNYLVVFYNDRAVMSAQTGSAFRNHFRQIQIVIYLIPSFHIVSPYLLCPSASSEPLTYQILRSGKRLHSMLPHTPSAPHSTPETPSLRK